MIKLKDTLEIIDDVILRVYNETTKVSIDGYNIHSCASHRFDNLEVKKISSGIDGGINIIVIEPIKKPFVVIENYPDGYYTIGPYFSTKKEAETYIEQNGKEGYSYKIKEIKNE